MYRVEKLWEKLTQLPAINITYEDGQQILWIMLRKEDFKKAVKEIYNKKVTNTNKHLTN